MEGNNVSSILESSSVLIAASSVIPSSYRPNKTSNNTLISVLKLNEEIAAARLSGSANVTGSVTYFSNKCTTHLIC